LGGDGFLSEYYMRKHRNRFSFQDQLTPRGGLLRPAMTFVEAHACLVRSQEPQKHFDHGAPVSMIIEELNKGYQRSSSFKEKLMRFILLLLLSFFAFLWCEETKASQETKVSPQAAEALNLYYSELNKEKQKYLAAAYKVQVRVKNVLENDLKTRTQKGDLDGALAIKKVIADLEKEMITDDPLFGYIAPGLYESLNKAQPIKQPQSKQEMETLILHELLRGSWSHGGGRYVYTFSSDNTFVLVGSAYKGTFSVDGDSVTLKWAPNHPIPIQKLKYDLQKKSFIFDNAGGLALIFYEKK
jgi:hypothetical protein